MSDQGPSEKQGPVLVAQYSSPDGLVPAYSAMPMGVQFVPTPQIGMPDPQYNQAAYMSQPVPVTGQMSFQQAQPAQMYAMPSDGQYAQAGQYANMPPQPFQPGQYANNLPQPNGTPQPMQQYQTMPQGDITDMKMQQQQGQPQQQQIMQSVKINEIPNGNVLFPQDCPPFEKSTAAFELSCDKNVVDSFDPVLDHDIKALWSYFMTHANNKPTLKVNIVGFHWVVTERVVITRDENGNQHRHVHHDRTKVVDFRYNADLSGNISDGWTRVTVHPNDTKTQAKSFTEILEEYAHSDSRLKDLHMLKQVPFNLDYLREQFVMCAKAQGYLNEVEVSFDSDNIKISAHSSHLLSRAAHNTVLQVLCVLSCLCIFAAPIYYAARQKVSCKIVADYARACDEIGLVEQHRQGIRNAIGRNFGVVGQVTQHAGVINVSTGQSLKANLNNNNRNNRR